jgi:hypothetical protein
VTEYDVGNVEPDLLADMPRDELVVTRQDFKLNAIAPQRP